MGYHFPNLLSLSRVALTPPLLVLLVASWPNALLMAAGLFVVATLTDIVDGYLARRHGAVSRLGVFLDLAADKLLVSPVLVILVFRGTLPAWMASIIIGREVMVMVLRWVAIARGKVIPAAAWGKGKTVVTSMGISTIILGLSLRQGGWVQDINLLGWVNLVAGIAYPLMLVATFLTVASGVYYVRLAWPVILERQEPRGTLPARGKGP